MWKRIKNRLGLKKNARDLPGTAHVPEGITLAAPDTIDDRGPAKYFHGRKEVLSLFSARRTRASVGGPSAQGTTFLIQGAPGAGKTALLYRCAVEAAEDGWTVAEIDSRALYDPASMASWLDQPYIARTSRQVEIDLKVARGTRSKETGGITSVSQLLREAAASTARGLLLVLDEVQTLVKLAASPHELNATDTLNLVHNGKAGGPVILLAGGLGTSEAAFSSLGVSRFYDGCVVNLGRLAPEPERAIIRDWLVRDGGAEGDATPWIDAIAKETHGWPQHIIAFAEPAALIVRSNHGQMTPDGLEAVLQQGQQRKENYYFARVQGISKQDRVALSMVLSMIPPDTTLQESEVLEIFSGNRSRTEAQRVFESVLHKGVLAATLDGDYAVPIPSMHYWLVEQYNLGKCPS